MKTDEFRFPAWTQEGSEEEQRRHRARYLLRFASILATPECSPTALSLAIGLHPSSLNAMLSAGTLDAGFPVNIIKGIETLIGTGTLPRSILNPDVYDGNY